MKIRGESWRAVTERNEPIATGVRVIVTKAYGTTLWVEPVETE